MESSEYAYRLRMISSITEKNNITTYYNSVGSDSIKDKRIAKIYSDILNKYNVKLISIRDNTANLKSSNKR